MDDEQPQELEEVAVVATADAVVNPGTVVVENLEVMVMVMMMIVMMLVMIEVIDDDD